MTIVDVILIACFSGQIIARLLVSLPGPSINTFENLAKHPDLKVIVWERTFFHTLAEQAREDGKLINLIEPRNLNSKKDGARNQVSHESEIRQRKLNPKKNWDKLVWS